MKREERGASMVEFAIILPVLLLLVLGIIEFGYRYMRSAQLNNYTYIAARDMSISTDGSTISSDTLAKISAITSTAPTKTQTCPAVPTTPVNAVVTLNATLDSPTGFFGSSTFTVHAKGEARCDG